MEPVQGASLTELAEIVQLFADRSYSFAQDLAAIDSLLPEPDRILDPRDSGAPEVLQLAGEHVARERAEMLRIAHGPPQPGKEEEEGYMRYVCRLAQGLLGDQASLVEEVPFVLLPAGRINASVLKTQSGGVAIALDSGCFAAIPHLVLAYMALDTWNETPPFCRDYPQEEFAKTILCLAAYAATGETRYMRAAPTLKCPSVPADHDLVTTGTTMIHLFLVLHEYGHLFSDVQDSTPTFPLTPTLDGYKAESLSGEIRADDFALEKLCAAGMARVDAVFFVGLLLQFQALAEVFSQRHGLDSSARQHPPAIERWRHLVAQVASDPHFSQSNTARLDGWFHKLSHFGLLPDPRLPAQESPATDKSSPQRACARCGRLVKNLRATVADGAQIIVTEDLAREGGASCAKCNLFTCLGDCSFSLGDSTARHCPACGERIAWVLPVQDTLGTLSSRAPVEQLRAAVTMIAQYGKQGTLNAARAVYELIKGYVPDETADKAMANERAKAAVTLLIDVGLAGHFDLAEEFFHDAVLLADAFPSDRDLAHRKAEACLNLFGVYGSAHRIQDAERSYSSLKSVGQAWKDDSFIASLALGTAANLFVLRGELDESADNMPLVREMITLCDTADSPDDSLGEKLGTIIFVTLSKALDKGDIDAGLRLYGDGERLATSWGTRSFRAVHAQAGRRIVEALTAADRLTAATAVHDRLVELAEAHPDEPDLRAAQVATSIDLGIAYARVSDLAGERSLHDRLAGLALGHPTDDKLKEAHIISGLNLIRSYEKLGQRPLARRVLADIYPSAARHPKAKEFRRLIRKTTPFGLRISLMTSRKAQG